MNGTLRCAYPWLLTKPLFKNVELHTRASFFFGGAYTRREVCVTVRISKVEIIMCVICKESCDLLSIEKK